MNELTDTRFRNERIDKINLEVILAAIRVRHDVRFLARIVFETRNSRIIMTKLTDTRSRKECIDETD